MLYFLFKMMTYIGANPVLQVEESCQVEYFVKKKGGHVISGNIQLPVQ